MSAAIQTHALCKRFGRVHAVEGVELMAPEGAVYGFLGPNGAGKTTTIRMALGLLRPSAGSISIFGVDVSRERLKTAAMIGSIVEEPALYARLTGRENLELTRRILGAPKSEIDRVLKLVDLSHAAGRLAGTYSQGMRQRLGIARALLGSPRLLMLDEPTNGLDPEGIREIRELVRRLPGETGATVFVSSHLLAEVEQMATHVGFMHKGRLKVQGTLEALKSRTAGVVEIGVSDAAGAASSLSEHAATVTGRNTLRVQAPEGAEPDAFAAGVNARLVGAGFGVFRLVLPSLSLEDIYLKATEAAQ